MQYDKVLLCSSPASHFNDHVDFELDPVQRNIRAHCCSDEVCSYKSIELRSHADEEYSLETSDH